MMKAHGTHGVGYEKKRFRSPLAHPYKSTSDRYEQPISNLKNQYSMM